MTRRFTLSSILITLLSPCLVSADDWPQFLGPNRNGISLETGLIDSFPESGPEVIWRKSLGVGMSSIAIADGLAYTVFQDSVGQYVVALDEISGEQKWQTKLGSSYSNSMGSGPRATPTIQGDKLYAFTGEGILCALNAKNGDLLWTVNTPDDVSAKPAEYGMASSPLVVGDAVVVQVGARNAAVVAYDRGDGTRLWAAGSGAAGYSSPVLMNLAGKEQIVAFVGAAALGIDPESGAELWKVNYVTDYNCNTACPVQLDDSSLLISAGEKHGSTVLKIKRSGQGFEAETGWSSLGGSSVLRAEWQTPALIGGYLFALDNIGSAGPVTNLVCVRAEDGNQMWAQPKFGKSNLTMADGKLFLSTMRGELVLVKASTEGFEEVSRAKVLQMQTRQAPVIANGKLYLRDDNEVVCLKVSQD
ncbi:MAG: outer membrane protein assembly factor BamB [Verrucomicrobiales bacterium]|jgi:outer membrane protein assembly factor BamB